MGHVAHGRIVYTFEPDGRPAGLIIAVWCGPETIFVEHVTLFRGGGRALLAMLRDGVATARSARWPCSAIEFYLRDDHPLVPKLVSLATRLGAEPVDLDDRGTYWRMTLTGGR